MSNFAIEISCIKGKFKKERILFCFKPLSLLIFKMIFKNIEEVSDTCVKEGKQYLVYKN